MGRSTRRVIGSLVITALGAAFTLPAASASPPAEHHPSSLGRMVLSRGRCSRRLPRQLPHLAVSHAGLGSRHRDMRHQDLLRRHRTTDGGDSWTLLGNVPAPISVEGEPDSAGVTDVRFVTSDVGWAFGPKLFQTTRRRHVLDPGCHSRQGKQVLSLAATGSAGAYAVVSMCKYAGGPCGQPLSFWRTSSLESSAWKPIKVDLPDLPGG